MTRQRNNLFTLIEILAVMVILSILIAITIGSYSLITDTLATTKTETLIKQLSSAMQAYKLETGYYIQMPSDDFSDLAGSSEIQLSGNPNVFKINLSGVVDTEFVKHFDYEGLKGKGQIKSSGAYYYFIDAWDRPVIYKNPGEFNTSMFDIGSLGSDGRYGDNSSDADKFGEGDDITNFNR